MKYLMDMIPASVVFLVTIIIMVILIPLAHGLFNNKTLQLVHIDMLKGQVLPLIKRLLRRVSLEVLVLLGTTILLLGLVDNSWATVNVVKYPSGTSVAVCQPSDSNSSCGGGGSGSNYWNLGTGNVGITTANNVGIGSVTPGAALDVVGNTRTQLLNSTYTTTNGATESLFSNTYNINSTFGFAQQHTSILSNTLVPSSNGNNLNEINGLDFFVEQNGGGNINSQDGIIGQVYNAGGGTVADAEGVYVSSGNTSTGSITSLYNFDSQVYAAGGNIGSAYGLYIEPLNVSGGGSITNNYGIYIDNQTGATGLDYALYSASPQPTYFSSNVGIGSTAPGQRLDVQGTIRTTGFKLSGNTLAGYVLTDVNGNNLGSWQPATGGSSQWTGTNPIYFNGNVGIGSTIPGDSLDVQGTIRTIHSGIALDVEGTTSVAFFNGGIGIGTTIPGGGLNQTNGGLVVMNGNIGIGTWNPIAALQLVTGGAELGTSACGNYLTSSSSNGVIRPYCGGFSEKIYNNSNTAGIDVFTTGNVGLGSVSPGAVLDVEGTVVFNGLKSSNINVGIGTYNPGVMLDVQGTIRSTGQILYTPIPTVSVPNCGVGGSPSVGALSTDYSGNIGIGTISTVTCILTTGHTWRHTPNCTCGVNVSTPCWEVPASSSTTQVYYQLGAGQTSKTITYVCGADQS